MNNWQKNDIRPITCESEKGSGEITPNAELVRLAQSRQFGHALITDGSFCEIYGANDPETVAGFAALKENIRSVCSRTCEDCDYRIIVVRENTRESLERICDLNFIQ